MTAHRTKCAPCLHPALTLSLCFREMFPLWIVNKRKREGCCRRRSYISYEFSLHLLQSIAYVFFLPLHTKLRQLQWLWPQNTLTFLLFLQKYISVCVLCKGPLLLHPQCLHCHEVCVVCIYSTYDNTVQACTVNPLHVCLILSIVNLI